MSKALTETQAMNKTYRFGKILALDFYATSAAIIIWTAISRSSAAKRRLKDILNDEEFDTVGDFAALSPHITHKPKPSEKPVRKFTEAIQPLLASPITSVKPRGESYSEAISAENNSEPQLGIGS